MAYVNDIWRNMESTIRLFADDCVIYRKVINNADMEKFQKDLDRLGVATRLWDFKVDTSS